MVKVCPSKLCNQENPDGNIYCNKCGLELKQNKMEAEGRDELFKLFKEVGAPKSFTEEQKKLFEEMTRKDFDRAIERHVGMIYVLLMRAFANNMKEIKALKSESKDAKPDIEEEKLKVLK